jgi:predicted ATP-binding protein involved in virulence
MAASLIRGVIVYLKKLRLQNIKCFEDVTLEFPHRDRDYSGWNVILGGNGLGKSTIVRCIAESIIGYPYISIIDNNQWVARRAKGGSIGCVLVETQFDDSGLQMPVPNRKILLIAPKQLNLDCSLDRRSGRGKPENSPGWLACGYGPYRRLDDRAFPFPLPPMHAPFLTILNEWMGISEPFSWIRQIYAQSLDPKAANRAALAKEFPILIAVINALLPGPVRIKDVSTVSIKFETLGGVETNALQLSDGYRSFLALAVDLMMRVYQATDHFSRYVELANEKAPPRILAEGIVLIDEADAHLHPSWQRELGQRLCQVFPKIQFIVTTHSPFIAQEATDGGLFVLKAGESGAVTVEKPIESVRGWTASQILTSPLFGLESTRDPETEEKIRESGRLNAKEQAKTLTKVEKKQLAELRKWLEKRLSAPGETYEEMLHREEMNAYVEETLKRLKNGQS